MYDVIIIGSGPAGLSAAIYAGRAKFDTLIIEEKPMSGGQIVNTSEVDNYPGLPGVGGFELAQKMREHAQKSGVTFVKAGKEASNNQSEPVRSKSSNHCIRSILPEAWGTGGGKTYRYGSFILCYLRWSIFPESDCCGGRRW